MYFILALFSGCLLAVMIFLHGKIESPQMAALGLALIIAGAFVPEAKRGERD